MARQGAEVDRRLLACVAALLLAVGAYAAVVIRDFHGPIGDHSESFLSEYLTWYFSTHVQLLPVPRFDLTNDSVLYPFGANGALQSWCIERELFYTALARNFGVGPWLQLYYLASLLCGTLGTFALLRGDHGDTRATVAALLANVLNYYGAQKYPCHFNMAVVHWATLGIVCDFVLAGRAVSRRPLTPTWLLLRALLAVLAFGLELGHILGFALTSLLFSGAFILALWMVRWRRGADPRAAWRAWRAAASLDWRAHRRRIVLLAVGIAGVSWIYGALVVGVVRAATVYDFGGLYAGTWWAHPIRLIIPYFPFLHPSQQPRYLRLFGDQAEVGIGSGGAGWLLLVLAMAGLFQARRRLLRYVPLLVTLGVFALSRPGFDLMRWMPWFAFLRVLSRSTVVYSVLFALCAIDLSLRPLTPGWRRMAALALGVIGALELWTVAAIKLAQPAYSYPPEFHAHMRRIAALPGEAVLDFPFCLCGGNGAIGNLCPIEQVRSVYALQRFHHKKVIGQYLGRLHPLQAQPFVDAGWPLLLLGDADDNGKSQRIDRCPEGEAMDFISDFYMNNDFSGIQLAIDRLPAGCAERFYQRFGAPMGEVALATAGRLAFLPRDPATFVRVDREAGKRVVLPAKRRLRALDGPIDVLRPRRNRFELRAHGLDDIEFEGRCEECGSGGQVVSWGLAPETTLEFSLAEARTVVLDARFWVPQRGQVVEVALDGTTLARWESVIRSGMTDRSLRVPATAGAHLLRLRYALGNGPPDHFAPDDPRPLGVRFETLRLDIAPPD
ncbi:MAG: hypothetical protein EXR72_15715 [Myxococcales bacterium]|nr:hypothetical protein [Myxococcales bacterium]